MRFLKSFLIVFGILAPLNTAWAECRLAVLGDSLSAGYNIAFTDAFPAQLERYLAANNIECEVQNHGVSGDTTAGGLARIDWVLGANPTHMIVELGGNDGMRALPTANMQANLEGIIETAQANGIPVLLAGMLAPPNLGDEYADAFAKVYADLAEKYELTLYPFFLDGVITNPELMLDDGIHPNPDGVGTIVERFGPTVIQWLNANL